MKHCKIYSTEQNCQAGAVIVDGRVLMAGHPKQNGKPICTMDGTHYYPPRAIAGFVKNMLLIPFSVRCAWGELGECDHNEFYDGQPEEDDPRPFWAVQNDVITLDEQWGYCNASGEIAIVPQWEHCQDFNEDYLACVKGGGYWIIREDGSCAVQRDFRQIQLLAFADALVQCNDGRWGAINLDRDWDYWIVTPEWARIWYDGGAFTVMRHNPSGRAEYLLMNACNHTPLIEGLTDKPIRYDPQRKNSLRDFYDALDFRILSKDGKYGLAEDLERGNSRIVLAPEYEYEEILALAYDEEVKSEIHYYALIISRTPRHTAGRPGDGWDAVPADIRDAVLHYMEANHIKQPDTAKDLQEE